MAKMNLYVCENHDPEFKGACSKQGLTDVAVVPFPSTCIDKTKIAEAVGLFSENTTKSSKGVVLCSKHCEICALVPPDSVLKAHPVDYCFSHLASESFINYVLAMGGYIIGSGWLRNWRQRITDAGFDQETARIYYQDLCKELVFFDAGFDPDAERDLTDLSLFLALPFVVIPVALESIQLMISSALAELQLNTNSAGEGQTVTEIQAQCTEYAAIFDLMGRIFVNSNKRDAIKKVKEIFTTVFGAQQFYYWSNDLENTSLPEEIKALMLDDKREPLTGLYNRTYINQTIDQQTQNSSFTVFMFDIDRLKFVNDKYGHAEGDKLIVSVASLLKKCFREKDIVARIGGDEYVAIIQGEPMESSDMIVRRIRQQVDLHNRNRQDDHLKISFSIGYATREKPEDSIETIMNSADEQMYKGKASRISILKTADTNVVSPSESTLHTSNIPIQGRI